MSVRSVVLPICILASLLWSSFSAEGAKPARPNVLLILADDFGWGDVGFHGGTATTPHLDRLAREGVELSQHYVNPQCSPTRSALLSGRYASRFDNLVASNAPAFPDGTVILPAAFHQAGYSTAIIGKWHLGSEPGSRPWEQGFDHSYGALTGAVHPWMHTYRKGDLQHTWHRDGQPLDEVGVHTTDLLAKECEAWLTEQTSDRPWLLYLPFFAVHAPVDAPVQWKARYSHTSFFEEDDRNEAAMRYAAMTSHMDDAIGRVLKVIVDKGWDTNTLVIFLSDNGPVGHEWKSGSTYGLPALPSVYTGSAGPLRGTKGSTWEGGVRTPAIAYWPGTLQPGVMDAPACAADWFPTLAGLIGWQPDCDLRWDGRDIWPLLTRQARPDPQRVLYCKYAAGEAFLRRGDWKLVTLGDSKAAVARMPCDSRADQLFNVADDPNETHDLAAERPELLAELQQLLIEEMKKDDICRVHTTAQHQWSRVPEQAARILPAPENPTPDE